MGKQPLKLRRHRTKVPAAIRVAPRLHMGGSYPGMLAAACLVIRAIMYDISDAVSFTFQITWMIL
jgi:hypothetical protein